MFVQISTAMIPENEFQAQLGRVKGLLVARHKAAAGFVSLAVIQRTLVGYVELQVLSVWWSKEALLSFQKDTSRNSDAWLPGCVRIDDRVCEVVFEYPVG